MISRARLNEHAQEWSLSERVIEKDYVIGWLLWGVNTEPSLRQSWVFKGGTCLKKCYVETYRFSEDLDFTVIPGGPLLPADVQPLFAGILDRIQQASGIDFAARPPLFKQRGNWPAVEGRVYYRGPRRFPGVESVKLDLLGNEAVVRPTVLRAISHPYPDSLPQPGTARCYSFEELFAEKIRALGERCRARDLYDVVNLYRRRDLPIQPQMIAAALAEKCAAKGIPIPSFLALESSPARGELESEWRNMLEHQLPLLPPFEHYWHEVSNVFAWLEEQHDLKSLPVLPIENVDSWRPPATIESWGLGIPLETIRFAAANHLCVTLGYKGETLLIEPYSLRRSHNGQLFLHGLQVDSRVIRSCLVNDIELVRVTDRLYQPVYRIEFAQATTLITPPAREDR